MECNGYLSMLRSMLRFVQKRLIGSSFLISVRLFPAIEPRIPAILHKRNDAAQGQIASHGYQHTQQSRCSLEQNRQAADAEATFPLLRWEGVVCPLRPESPNASMEGEGRSAKASILRMWFQCDELASCVKKRIRTGAKI